MKNGARPEEIKQAKSQLNATQAIKDTAKGNLDRMQTMFNEGLISQSDVDKANTSYQEANGQYEVAEQQYKMALKGPRDEE